MEAVFAVFTMLWLVFGLVELIRFLGLYLPDLKFERDGKITTAYVSSFHHYTPPADYENCCVNPSFCERNIPVVTYYDEYIEHSMSRTLSCDVIKSSFQKKDGSVDPTPFYVQYTRNSVRLYDERYIKISDYKGKRQGIFTLISVFGALICFIGFVICL